MDTCVEPQMAESLSRNSLVHVLDAGRFQSFYMKRLGEGRIMSCLVTFTPEGIVIQGDITPGHHGNVSALGYGLGWFRSQLSEDYLAEKFLQRDWYPEVAEEHLRYMLKDIAKGNSEFKAAEEIKAIEELADQCGDKDLGVESFISEWEQIEAEWDELPGIGYKPHEQAWLCAIQQKFAQLYDLKEAKDLAWQNNGLGYAICR